MLQKNRSIYGNSLRTKKKGGVAIDFTCSCLWFLDIYKKVSGIFTAAIFFFFLDMLQIACLRIIRATYATIIFQTFNICVLYLTIYKINVWFSEGVRGHKIYSIPKFGKLFKRTILFDSRWGITKKGHQVGRWFFLICLRNGLRYEISTSFSPLT